METGFRGTFVISWTQTETDGQQAADPRFLVVGASWRWRGEAVRVDGPGNVLLLGASERAGTDRRTAARAVRKLVGAALSQGTGAQPGGDGGAFQEFDEPLMDAGFVITDGRRSYTASIIDTGPGRNALIMFLDELPPRDQELWVVHRSYDPRQGRGSDAPQGVICFTAGTEILTERGPRLVEELKEGDRLQTKDDGMQAVRWIGRRRISGARLYAMPEYRPIRIRAGAFGEDDPREDLLVSPDHRMLLRGAAAEALFNTDEVLVAARDLLHHRGVHRDLAVREVTYFHLLLDRHQILWANGVETESFHPANTGLDAIEPAQRAQLAEVLPGVEDDPHTYGTYARRNLSASEAAILLHEAA
ncbi:hypothetical protein PSA7680_02285 [Pseudoruegeria aquimaris]|uniref:Hedgehog/Intein (Hint) domain-containing protein n=1 Tax=Pseudoruegeria aquimaris TaxID=393663 RepID=A0A1Y5SRN9_9RHOB|nr:Hint domain-containing protein [Pseudoruegeria aquimaris]SLN45008.1 hypothetical protein PSA7680_02285 [Pseudoruegeria aquimaris]